MASKRYLLTFGAALVFWAAAIMMLNFVVDPLQFFRMADYRPNWSYEQRRQTPAIARSYEFQAAVFGHSAMGQVTADGVRSSLGLTAVHLGMNGSTVFEQYRLVRLATEHRRLGAVIWAVGADFALTAPPPADAVRSDMTTDPDYLYSRNPLRWSRYLFDLSATASSLTVALTRSLNVPGYRTIEQASLVLPPRDWVYGPASIARHAAVLRAQCVGGGRSQVSRSVFRHDPRPWPDHVERRIDYVRQAVAANPDVRFHIVLAPVHVSLWREQIRCGADWLAGVHVYDRLAERLTGLANVTIHDFRSIPAAFENNEFYDALHFSARVSQQMIDDIASGRRAVATADFGPATQSLLDRIAGEVCERTPDMACFE